MKRICAALMFVLSVSFMSPGQAFGNGVIRDSIGALSGGRGGTNIGHTDNGALIHDNPSALTEMDRKRLEVCFDFLAISMNYKDPDNDRDGKDILCFIPCVSYAQAFAQGRFGAGFGVYSPAGFSTDYDLVHPVYGRQEYTSEASLTKVLFGLGWKITDRLSLGVAAGPSFSKAKLKMPYTFQTGALKGVSGLMDLNGDDWAWASSLGAQWRISSDTTLGLAYQCQDTFHMTGETYLDTTGYPGLPIVDRTAHYDKVEFDLKWPQSLGAGVMHRLKEGHRISADVRWIDWSQAFDEITFNISEGDNPEYDALAGSSAKDTLCLGWKDSYRFSLGYEHLLTATDTLRAGYVYNLNPVPNSTLVPIIPAILEHLVSAGFGRKGKSWGVDAAYMYSFGDRQSVETSDILGGDFDDSSVDVDAHIFYCGVQYYF